jgi:hypothetical protein
MVTAVPRRGYSDRPRRDGDRIEQYGGHLQMTTPLPLPMRVLVKGASTVVAMSEWGNPREDFTFPRALEAALYEAGRPAEVRTVGVASERAKSTLKNWEREILAWSPDVVILVYGHYESIHYLLPWWLERHANSLKRRPGRVREAYRRRVLRPAWVSLAKTQSKLDARFDSTIRRNRPRQVAADLELLIERARSAGRPLVLLLDLLPPGERARSWFPGMPERIAVMNKTIAAMVAKVDDPEVRVFHVLDVVERTVPDGENPTPDGFHYSAPLHRAIGRALGEEVLAWAAKQSHLQALVDRDGN